MEEPEPSLAPLALSPVAAVLPPLLDRKNRDISPQQSHWRTAHRLVTPHPLHGGAAGSIETVWQIRRRGGRGGPQQGEERSESAGDDPPLQQQQQQQRIAIFGGPDAVSAPRHLQVSLQLPADAVAPPPPATTDHHRDGSSSNENGGTSTTTTSSSSTSSPPPCGCLQWTYFADDDDDDGNDNDNDNMEESNIEGKDADDGGTPTNKGSNSNNNSNSSSSKKRTPILACLVHPSAVTLWDVYGVAGRQHGSSSSGSNHNYPSEGWTVTLPFECRGMLALPNGGLLLQRAPDDLELQTAATTTATTTTNSAAMEGPPNTATGAVGEDPIADEFLLQGPPPSWKATTVNSSTNNIHGGAMPAAAAAAPILPSPVPGGADREEILSSSSTNYCSSSSNNNTVGGVASLFTLHHPLRDVLPVVVAVSTEQQQQQQQQQPQQAEEKQQHPQHPVTDALEQVLWVGRAEFISNGKHDDDSSNTSSSDNCTLMVTHHTRLGRHAVWRLRDAAPPPPEIPLYRSIRQRYHCGDATTSGINGANSNKNGRGWGDHHCPGERPEYWPALASSHDLDDLDDLPGGGGATVAAAAAASQRVSRDEALADALGVASRKTSLGGGGVAAASSRKRQKEGLFSPTSNMNSATTSMDVSHNNFSTAAAAAAAATTALLPPPHALYAKHAVQCLYTDDCNNETATTTKSPPASHIFLASDLECTGTKVLAMVMTTMMNGREQMKELKLLALEPITAATSTDLVLNVRPLDRIPCLGACPLQACPVPARSHDGDRRGERKEEKVTDILVLRQTGRLELYRANEFLTQCVLPGIASDRTILDLNDAIHDRANFCIGGPEASANEWLRCQLKLSPSCLEAERVLAAIDAALFPDHAATALQIRLDCCRLAHSIQGLVTPGSAPVRALREILLALLLYETGADQTRQRGVSHANEIPAAGSGAWEALLRSAYHHMHGMDNLSFVEKEKMPDDENIETDRSLALVQEKMEDIGMFSLSGLRKSGATGGLSHRIFDSIHLLLEDAKLSNGSAQLDTSHTMSLLVELYQTVRVVHPTAAPIADKFLEYYGNETNSRLFNDASNRAAMRKLYPSANLNIEWKMTSFASPPSIIAWIEKRLKGKAENAEDFYDRDNGRAVNAACAQTRSILRIFTVLARNSGRRQQERDVCLVQTLLDEGFSDPTMIREDLPPGIALPILEALYRLRNYPDSIHSSNWSPEAWALVGRKDLGLNMIDNLVIPDHSAVSGAPEDKPENFFVEDEAKDGLVPLERSSAMIFPKDNRVHEAARLLRSSRPIFLRVARAVEVSDHDYERLKQKRLTVLVNRSLALPVGRGMLTIGSLRPVPAEPLPVPEICLKGKVPPTNATLNLDISDSPTDMQVWPDFHNGVAAGLRLPAEGEQADLRSTITRPWVIHNRPPVNRPPVRESGDDAPPPPPKNYSHGGLLYALGLRGHLTVLEMSDYYEYLTQGTVTTTVGVLLGLAANKRGSCDMSVSKMICLHIPSLIPQHFSAIDVASTVQAAAVTASGLLYQGSSSRMMTEFLLNAIGKRPESDGNTADREAYTLACGLALGTVNLAKSSKGGEKEDGLADLHIEERLLRFIIGGVDQDEARRTRESNDRFSIPSAASGSDSEKCSTIYEGSMINTDVTAPGATLALGLMYMKSDNKTIADAMALPDTHFLLDFVRPDFLGLRVISRALILWSEVQPTDEWIESQVPLVVRKAYAHIRSTAKAAYGIHSPKGSLNQAGDYDRRAVRQMYVHVVSGACFGMGLRFAGTGSAQAKAALMKRVSDLHALRDANDPVSTASRPEIPILDTCLASAAISLAMVMAGTGDLEVLRLLKIVRWRCDEDSRYGIHMTYGMAIGLLFLGGGTCTIGREPGDIAALVTAFFPRFPTTTTDNQFHLQALRHLYALAVKRKELRAIDVDTGEMVYVPIRIRTEGMAEPQHFKVPCLLRNSDSPLKELEILSEKYYPLRLDLSRHRNSYVFYVKKRTASIASKLSLPSFPRQLVGQKAIVARKSTFETVKSLTDDPFLVAFADYICESSSENKSLVTNADFSTRAILECLTSDSDEALTLYLAIHQGIRSLGKEGNTAFLGNLQLIRTYCQERRRLAGGSNQSTLPLLNTQLLLPYLQELTDKTLLN